MFNTWLLSLILFNIFVCGCKEKETLEVGHETSGISQTQTKPQAPVTPVSSPLPSPLPSSTPVSNSGSSGSLQPTPTPIAQPSPTPQQVEKERGWELYLSDLINDYRKEQGEKELIFDDKVSLLARSHSQDMADGAIPLGHTGFSDRFDQMKNYFQLSRAGENVAMNFNKSQPLENALKQWINSPDHKKNLLRPWGAEMESDKSQSTHGLTGIGVVQADDGSYYFTQIFVEAYSVKIL